VVLIPTWHLWLAMCGVGCGTPEPILLGVVAQAQETREGLTIRSPKAYVKPKGVYVDVGHLCGRSLDEVRDDLSEQLGDILASTDLNPKDGRELTLDRGKVRIKDGRIYMVRVELEGTLRRSTALQSVGLPPTVRKWNTFTYEYNTRYHAGFERIRMGRLSPESEEVLWVEVMKASPRR
jgi:hypothetical protein